MAVVDATVGGEAMVFAEVRDVGMIASHVVEVEVEVCADDAWVFYRS